MATGSTVRIEGGGDGLAAALRGALAAPAPLPCLVNADAAPQADAIVARCTEFAAALPDDEEALVVTILRAAPPGLASFARHAGTASLWTFTRQAALDWAPRGVRVNAIGLGASPFDATPQSVRAATNVPADPASLADLVRTIQALTCFRSMTGQIIRLGPPMEAWLDLPPHAA